MKRSASPDQTLPSRRPRLRPPEAQPVAVVEDDPTPPTAVEDVPVVHPPVHPSLQQPPAPGRQTDRVVLQSFAESGSGRG